jgi:hypothetical protein
MTDWKKKIKSMQKPISKDALKMINDMKKKLRRKK